MDGPSNLQISPIREIDEDQELMVVFDRLAMRLKT
jgi:hypothetical protein